jgi:urocanate hydratase
MALAAGMDKTQGLIDGAARRLVDAARIASQFDGFGSIQLPASDFDPVQALAGAGIAGGAATLAAGAGGMGLSQAYATVIGAVAIAVKAVHDATTTSNLIEFFNRYIVR